VRMMPASSVESADVACAQLPDYDFPVGTSFETQPRIAVNGKTTRMFKTRAQWQCAALSHVVTGRDCVCSKIHLVRNTCDCFALLSAGGCFSVHEQYVPSTKTVDDESRAGGRRSSHPVSIYALAVNGDGSGAAREYNNGNRPFVEFTQEAWQEDVAEGGFYQHASTSFLDVATWGYEWRGGVLGNRPIHEAQEEDEAMGVRAGGRPERPRKAIHYFRDAHRSGVVAQRDPKTGKHQPFERIRLLCLDDDGAGAGLVRQRANIYGAALFGPDYTHAVADRLVTSLEGMVKHWLPWCVWVL
jgi:hypothetical protein